MNRLPDPTGDVGFESPEAGDRGAVGEELAEQRNGLTGHNTTIDELIAEGSEAGVRDWRRQLHRHPARLMARRVVMGAPFSSAASISSSRWRTDVSHRHTI